MSQGEGSKGSSKSMARIDPLDSAVRSAKRSRRGWADWWKGVSTGELTRAHEFAHVSSAIQYCGLLDGSGDLVEDYSRKKDVDGRSHRQQFKDLAMSIRSSAAVGTPATEGMHPEGTPRFALMCLKEHDLLVTGTPRGPVAVLIKKGAWPAAIADRLGRGGPPPRIVQLAGWVLVIYVAAAILPGLYLVWSLLSGFMDSTFGRGTAQYATFVSGNLSVLLGFTGLVSLPGYLKGDVGWRRTLTWALSLNLIAWLVPLGYNRPSFILFCAIPIVFLVLNQMGDTKEYFNLR